MLEVAGEVNRRHPSATQLPFDRVASGECGLQTREQIGQASARVRGNSIIGLAREPGQSVAHLWRIPPAQSSVLWNRRTDAAIITTAKPANTATSRHSASSPTPFRRMPRNTLRKCVSGSSAPTHWNSTGIA
jgi:hypothetical protein